MRCLPYYYIFDGPEAEFETKNNFYKAFLLHPYVARRLSIDLSSGINASLVKSLDVIIVISWTSSTHSFA